MSREVGQYNSTPMEQYTMHIIWVSSIFYRPIWAQINFRETIENLFQLKQKKEERQTKQNKNFGHCMSFNLQIFHGSNKRGFAYIKALSIASPINAIKCERIALLRHNITSPHLSLDLLYASQSQ